MREMNHQNYWSLERFGSLSSEISSGSSELGEVANYIHPCFSILVPISVLLSFFLFFSSPLSHPIPLCLSLFLSRPSFLSSCSLLQYTLVCPHKLWLVLHGKMSTLGSQ